MGWANFTFAQNSENSSPMPAKEHSPGENSSPLPPLRVAILPFTNVTHDKEYEWLGIGMAEVLTTKLGTLPCFQLVERVKLSEALKDMELAQTGIIDETTAPHVGKIVGAEEILTGSFQIQRKIIRIDSRLLEADSARVHTATETIGDVDKIFEVQDRVAVSMLSSLNITLTEDEKKLL